MILPSFKFGNEGVCTYCGDVSSGFDHCIPVAFQTTEARSGKMRKYGPQTPCCKRCNSKLHSKYFESFYERCQFASQCWKKELKPVLWSRRELDGLSGSLRGHVVAEMNKRLLMFNRADWIDTRDFWLNIENLTWIERLKVGSRSFHPQLHDYFRSTIALAEIAYSEKWNKER